MLTKGLFSAAAVFAVIFASGAGIAQAAGYKLKVIAAAGASQTYAVGQSSAGLIAGTYFLPKTSETKSYTYDTTLKSPTMVEFKVPPQHGGTVTDTTIAAISLHGDIVGNFYEVVGGVGTTYGFLYSGGTFTSLEFPGAVQTEASAVGSQGRYIAGTYATPGVFHAFVYDLKTYHEITAGGLGNYYGLQPATVNNSGFVTGGYFSVDRGQNRSFTTTGHAAVDFAPVAMRTCGITGANPPANVLVGYCSSPMQAMVRAFGTTQEFSAPGATSTSLGAISVKNIAAGTAVVAGVTYIFSADPALNYTLVAAPSTWSDISTVGINSASKIVGRFTDQDGKTKVFWAH